MLGSMRINKQRSGFSITDLLIVIAVLGILIALLLPAISAAREAARRNDCSVRLRQVALATTMYGTMHKDQIPVGIETATHFSGFVDLLPYLELNMLSEDYDRSKPADKNEVLRFGPAIFKCPSDNPEGTWKSPGGGTYGRSNYLMNFGSAELKSDDGPFKLNSNSGFGAISDGTVNTAFYSEIVSGGENKMDPNGAWGYGDAGTSAYTHKHLPNAGDKTVLGGGAKWAKAEATASSLHPGGVDVAFGDTHVSFVADNIDKKVWQAYGTRAGKEKVFAE
ncbi:MAG: DUF1559 domain-containing protein [Planctomycetales bacterium]